MIKDFLVEAEKEAEACCDYITRVSVSDKAVVIRYEIYKSFDCRIKTLEMLRFFINTFLGLFLKAELEVDRSNRTAVLTIQRCVS